MLINDLFFSHLGFLHKLFAFLVSVFKRFVIKSLQVETVKARAKLMEKKTTEGGNGWSVAKVVGLALLSL